MMIRQSFHSDTHKYINDVLLSGWSYVIVCTLNFQCLNGLSCAPFIDIVIDKTGLFAKSVKVWCKFVKV